jgi:hypothetical protein
MMQVVETAYAGHAHALASTVDLSTCPDGIICVGGDGIVNEVILFPMLLSFHNLICCSGSLFCVIAPRCTLYLLFAVNTYKFIFVKWACCHCSYKI